MLNTRRGKVWTCLNWKVKKFMLAFIDRKAREAGNASKAEWMRNHFAKMIVEEERARKAFRPADPVVDALPPAPEHEADEGDARVLRGCPEGPG
jgi:CRISPR/Cas system-associated protein Csm6